MMDCKSSCIVCWVTTLNCQPRTDETFIKTVVWFKNRLYSVCRCRTWMGSLCVWEDHQQAETLDGNWSGFHKQGNSPQSEEHEKIRKVAREHYIQCNFKIIKSISQWQSSHRSPGWSWTELWHCPSPWEHSCGPIRWFGWGEWAGWCGWCRLMPPSFLLANILSEKHCGRH